MEVFRRALSDSSVASCPSERWRVVRAAWQAALLVLALLAAGCRCPCP